ncbi:ATP-binding cassette domain-containing protein [Corynebacterium sp. HMSC05E07]|uniref:ATP-binding cassette domain-containing protein n=1 Tax=Corynebacterium sp. HMSC05E07 TaxID=1581117 RepID=UPI0009F242D3|nr:ATP-binding cassette domain-containing protein [Corynebacterium sp. HMSC05E07]
MISQYARKENLRDGTRPLRDRQRHCRPLQQGSLNDELKDLLSLVGLSLHHSVSCEHASLGMKQRLGIAKVLVGNPQLLLLDAHLRTASTRGWG